MPAPARPVDFRLAVSPPHPASADPTTATAARATAVNSLLIASTTPERPAGFRSIAHIPALWAGPKAGRTDGMERDDEVPEADAYEQELDAFPEDDDEEIGAVSDDPEAPEADAVEQAQRVPVDDEERE